MISIKFDEMFSLQAIEDQDKEKRRAERLQQRLTILQKDNEDVSYINFRLYK